MEESAILPLVWITQKTESCWNKIIKGYGGSNGEDKVESKGISREVEELRILEQYFQTISSWRPHVFES